MSLDDAIESLQRELTSIHDTIPRCARCEGFLLATAQARMDLGRIDTPAAREAAALFDGWLDEAEGRVRTYNHCDACVPTGPYERFTAALHEAAAAGR
jgi:hypothetical protein